MKSLKRELTKINLQIDQLEARRTEILRKLDDQPEFLSMEIAIGEALVLPYKKISDSDDASWPWMFTDYLEGTFSIMFVIF